LKKDFPGTRLAWHGEDMPKKPAVKPAPRTRIPRAVKKAQKRDFSQTALAVAEKASGSKIKPM
jgi:hypothetical protein